MEKCYTDVTEFAIPASTQKLYLSPVLDGFNSEIIAYNLSTPIIHPKSKNHPESLP
ncbi:IS3-Spn1 transposase [Streptococcus pneumoniae]|nr:IS3-Spn1 transposase [Streptococcus pneumoniae]